MEISHVDRKKKTGKKTIHLKAFKEFVSTRCSPDLAAKHSKAGPAEGVKLFWAIVIVVMKYQRSAEMQ